MSDKKNETFDASKECRRVITKTGEPNPRQMDAGGQLLNPGVQANGNQKKD